MAHILTLWVVNTALLMVIAAPTIQAIACGPYVYPCQCGLCPRIVDCAKKQTAECFCGSATPGIYPHTSDQSKFWMCSYDSRQQVTYGVEVACPGRLVFDPVVKACTVPSALTPLPPPAAAAAAPAAKPVRQSPVTPGAAKAATKGQLASSSNQDRSSAYRIASPGAGSSSNNSTAGNNSQP